MFRFTIRKKILLGLIIGALLPTILLEVLDIRSARSELEMQQIEALDAIVDLKQQRIESFFHRVADDALFMSHLELITEPLPVINAHFADRDNEEYQQARKRLDSHLIRTRQDKNFLEIILADKEGRMVYNTGAVHNDDELGMSVEALVSKDQFQEAQHQGHHHDEESRSDVYVSDVFKSPFSPSGFEMVAAAPVFDHHDGEYIGMIILAIDMGPVFELILDKTGLGETGETLIGRSEEDGALFINPLRYDKNAALARKVSYTSESALPIREATQGRDGSGVTTDYRPEPIIAAWRSLSLPSPDLKWGLVAKIDTSEAFAGSQRLLKQAIYIGIGAILLLILAYLYLGHAIVRPLNKLRKAAGRIAGGSLDVQVDDIGKDEIGDVGRSFNDMTKELGQARYRLAEQNKVLEGNLAELQEKNKEIEQSKRATLNILEDVQEEKEKTAREKERIAAMLDSIGDGVFVVDTNLNIQIINPVAATLAGCDPEAVIGKPYKESLQFVYEKDGKVNDRFIVEALRTGEVQEMANHTLLVRSDGTKIPVADSAAPLKNTQGKIYGCVVVFRDVSREYAIDKAKTEFVSLASHQLRTPLTAINWNLEMLIEEMKEKVDEEQWQALVDAHSSSIRMSELVNALLNVSRIELGTFAVDPEPTDIIALSKQVVKDLAMRIEKKKLKLAEHYSDKTLVVNIDPKLMRMVIENLITNAVKYTPEKKKIDITIEKTKTDLLITVRDEGCGIPKKQQSKVFSRLFRADNVLRKDVDGTGLGLYIVKSIIQQSQGKIWFDSEENVGTTFFVSLPIAGMEKKEGAKALIT